MDVRKRPADHSQTGKERIVSYVKESSRIRRPRNIIRMRRATTAKPPNIMKADSMKKQRIMHTPLGATGFTPEVTPRKLPKLIWRNTARNSC